jgi:23S rRNA (pseudouridine1915-N3)-methyltransferase
MKLVVVSFGHKRDELHQVALAEYQRRIVKPWSLAFKDLPSERRSETENPDTVMRRELDALTSAGVELDKSVLLDVKGKAHTSESLSLWLGQRQDAGERELFFVIGGADGIHPSAKPHAAALMSLSALTLPHRLARVVLAEQIYRSQSILRGEKYHR